MLFMGIDVGTQGARGIICDERGAVAAAHGENFASLNVSDYPGAYEQQPAVWWEAVRKVMKACQSQLKAADIDPGQVCAVSVDGTSGTILPVGEDGEALRPALMYNDMRAKEEAGRIHQAGRALEEKLGYQFNASYALPKILWMKEQLPEIHRRTWRYIHQTDYIVGKLCGIYDVTDYSNALKTGYDLMDNKWPDFLKDCGIDPAQLPRVVAPGERIGTLKSSLAREYGFSPDMLVAAGATDGYASALAAGAAKTGDWVSVIGTTMVLKGVTKELLADPAGSSYSHKLPSGAWMLGGAANMGGRCLNDAFSREQFEEMNQYVEQVIPTGVISFPLHGKGERFPFINPGAEAFTLGDISDARVHYASLMEGVAYAERFALEHMQEIGAEVGPVIYTAGGACKSPQWMKIRASVLNRELKVPEAVGADMGSALLAASAVYFSSLEEAVRQMITFQTVVQPDAELAAAYEALYQKAKAEYKRRFL